jgi:16S rRNA G966 N2-methylase RsmD
MAKEKEGVLYSTEEMNNMIKDSMQFQQDKPVVCLGREFPNDQARREYFREELRKKLPELRNIEGFPIGSDDDIINLSDPPYYTACPNPWLNDFIAQWEEEKKELVAEGKRKNDFEVKEPYVSDVSEGKFDPLYMYHSYLTKVPHKAIIKYLEHYTQEGDIIFDGFAGTGMSGAAARLSTTGKRKAICVDLSTLATFISYCVNSDIKASTFKQKAETLLKKVKNELSWMFETTHENGGKGIINYVLWSDVYTCPYCGEDLVYWHTAVDIKKGKILDTFECPNCKSALKKGQITKQKETFFDSISGDTLCVTKRIPVLINYTYNKKRYEKSPDENDLKIIEKTKNIVNEKWVPKDKTYEGDELSRAFRDGIVYFYQYYSSRVLAVLSSVKSYIDEPILNYLITKLAFQSTIMYRYTYMNGCWGAGGGPMSGTLYVPSLYKELNAFSQLDSLLGLREKIEVNDNPSNVLTSTQSALDVNNIPDCSIDYIFTDPPFGKNFMYSEMNRISEMWLKVHTNNKDECIISNTQNKAMPDYQNMMTAAFKQYYRILKPNKWLSVEFSNTSASVWTSIQYALQNAGFIVSNVAALDKKKGSFKAVTTTTAVNQDLVITCYKPSAELSVKFESLNATGLNVWDFVDEHMAHLPVHIERNNTTAAVVERSPKILFDRLISYYVQKGYPVPIGAVEFQKGLVEHGYIERDGMFFTASQAAEYDEKKKLAPEFVPMGIIVSDEANGIQWLKNQLRDTPKTYQEIQPEWMQAINGLRKGDILPELATLLEENFIQELNGKWRIPNIQDDVDKEALRTKSLLREFKIYVETANKPKGKIKEARVEALRAGFKQCYIDKDFQTIVTVGDKIPQNLLTEDEVLLQFYDIAQNKL